MRVSAAKLRQPLRYIGFGGQGKQVRDILHIDDLAELVAMQIGSMDRFRGLTLKIDRPRLTPEDEKRLLQESRRNNRASE